MLIRKEHTGNGGLLGIWKTDESCDDLLLLLPEKMRMDAVGHVKNLHSQRRAIEWLSTRILLFMMLGKEKTIRNNSNGKPYLEDGTYQISISHTMGYVAILIHETDPVGIDVEFRSERVSKVAEKFIGDNEFIDLSQKTVHQLLHWSAKESLFKLMEETEIHFKHHLHIQPFTPAAKGTMTATETKTCRNNTFTVHYEVHPDYVLTWIC